jgi:hypothetical protein
MFERYLISNLGRFWHIEKNKFVDSHVKPDNEDIALITLKHNKEENGTRTIRKIEAVYKAFFGNAGKEIKYNGDENEEKLSFAKFQLVPFADVKEDTANTSMKEKLAERRSLKKAENLNTANPPVTNDKEKNVTNNPPEQTREKHREYLFKLDPDSARILDSIKKKYKTTSDANAIKAVLKLYSEANA